MDPLANDLLGDNAIKNVKRNKKKRGKKVNKKNKDHSSESLKSSAQETNFNIPEKKRKFDQLEGQGDDDDGSEQSLNACTLDPDREKKNKKKKNKNKKAKLSQNKDASKPSTIEVYDEEEIQYPYEVQPDDHCETPIEAYEDLRCFLEYIAEKLNKSPSDLLIYDPYFCEGSMVERMMSLGYNNVYNRKEDFYQVQAANKVPEYDVLVTNPPYSQDHMERLIRFCTTSRKPFALLVPNYVYTKDYYQQIPGTNQIFYITPSQGRRYLYTTPKGRRQKKSGKYTSPFPTFWFCHIPSSFPSSANSSSAINVHAPAFVPPSIIQKVKQQAARIELARSKADIPISVAPDNDPRKKKLRNNLKRKKNKDRKKQ